MKGLLVGTITKMREATRRCQTERERNEVVYYMVNMYPVLEVAIVGLVRGMARGYLEENGQRYVYGLMGNEGRLLRNYRANLRNMPLNLVADALKMSVTVQY